MSDRTRESTQESSHGDKLIRVLSFGAGVQSTTLALMASRGELGPMPDCAIFADVGDEPEDVYKHLDWCMTSGELAFPVFVVRAWDGYGKASIKRRLGDEILASARGESKVGSHSRPPFFVANPDGTGKGMIRRQCTGDYKIEVIQQKERELLGLKPRQWWPDQILIEQWIGISTDEADRAKPATRRVKVGGETFLYPHKTIRNRWPLLEKRMSRRDCLEWLAARGYAEPPKSACVYCPYHSDDEWKRIKRNPNDWARAVEIDRAIRTGLVPKGLDGALFLHPSLKALETIDFDAPPPVPAPSPQLSLWSNECEGMCGV